MDENELSNKIIGAAMGPLEKLALEDL